MKIVDLYGLTRATHSLYNLIIITHKRCFMKQINASDFGIKNQQDITKNLIELLSYVKAVDGEKTIIFENGTYYIDSEKCIKQMLYITNTTGDEEYEKYETPHLNTIAFYLEDVSDLTIDGNNSVFIIDGKATNIALINSQNIVIKNLEIRHAHPDMHELKVVKKSLFSVDFEIDKDSFYEIQKGKMYFYGKDYRVAADKDAKFSWWIGLIRNETPDKVKRVKHPLATKLKIKDLGNGKIRVFYLNTSRFKIDDCYYIYDVRRQFAGVFIDKSKNVTLQNIKQSFNYSLALVVQDSENLTAEDVDFSPQVNGTRKLCSVADFIQLCMCRGKIIVKNSYFDGAGDDCLNVHGIHFKITEKNDNKIKVRFMHPQTHGFNPLRVNDEIAFINPETMLETGRAVIKDSTLLNEHEIQLTLDNIDKAIVGDVIEDISACPDLDFINNTATRIITRGLLITTRGKVNVENNRFISTTMSGILLSDDANNWYESGMCCDVTIKNNIFDYCGETPILIKPENKKHGGAVHKNIKIIGNTFNKYDGEAINIKSTDNVYIKDNRFLDDDYLVTKNCSQISRN